MKRSARISLTALLVTALPLASLAASTPGQLTLRCPVQSLPSQQAIGTALDLHNFGQVFAARQRLMQVARRACNMGVERIVVSSDRPSSLPPTWSQAAPRIVDAVGRAPVGDGH